MPFLLSDGRFIQLYNILRDRVEAALERYNKVGLTAEEDLDYRIHLRGAIDALPTDEREVIDLILADILHRRTVRPVTRR